MSLVIAIILLLIVIAAIGYAIIYAAMVFILVMVGASCLIAYAVIVTLIGDNNTGIAVLLAIPVGIGVAVLVSKYSQGKT